MENLGVNSLFRHLICKYFLLELWTMTFRTSITFCFIFITSIISYSQDVNFAVSEIEESLFKNANAIVRIDDTKVDQSSKQKLLIYNHVAITALNKRGSNLLTFRESYKEGSDKINDIEIKYYDKDGKLIREIGKKELQDLSAYDGFSMITDYRIKYFEFEGSTFPITVEWNFRKESENTLLIPSWFPVKTFGMAVEKSTYKNAAQLNHYYEKNLDHQNISKQPGEYSCANIQAYTKEKLSPSLYDLVPFVLFSPKKFQYEGYEGQFNNWTELGQWRYDSFLKDRNNLITVEVKKELDGLIGQENDPEKIARIIYDYVQETTRYINIALDEGGVRPMKSNDVHTKKYGDCKALSFYMKSLLDIYNIDANYVEIYADSDIQRSYIPEFCSATQGNHIILNIPLGQDTAWVDCTSSQLPFNFLSSFTDNRRALMVTETGGQLVKTPKYSALENQTNIISDILISENGDATIKTEIRNKGLRMSERLFLIDSNEEDWEDNLKNNTFSSLNNLSIQVKQKEISELDIEMVENYSLESTSYGSIAGKYMILPIAFKKFSIPRLKKTKSRKYNINLKRANSNHSIQKIKIPDGYSYTDDLLKEHIETKFGNYKLKMKVLADQIIIERFLTIYDGSYKPDAYSEIRSFFNKIMKTEQSKISIKQL